MNNPNVNVTPLIDVLLVLLVIFMIVAPGRSNSFRTRIPSEREMVLSETPHPDTLTVLISADGSLRLNGELEMGTTSGPGRLIERLRQVFTQRIENGNISGSFSNDPERTFNDKIERCVFIKAPKNSSYGEIVKVIDAAKFAGAFPISLQIDDLE